MISEPRYDEDTVTLGYLNKVLDNDVVKIVATNANKNYTIQPEPPYEIGDTWTEGPTGNMYRCIKSRAIGHYTASDWELATGNPTSEDYNDLLTKYQLLSEQVDKKIESFYQTNDPADSWLTSIEKEKHVGDVWYNPDTGVSKQYLKENNSYLWKVRDVPNSLYDKIDGKKTIYTTQPTSYEINDAWFIGSDATNIPTGCAVGDLVIATRTSTVFSVNDWSKKDNYSSITYVNTKNQETIQQLEDEIENTVKPSILQTAQANATDLINAFNTGHWIKYNGNSYLCDTEDINTAQNIWAFTLGGIGHSNNGISGPFETAITMDGKINASMILTGTLLADFIKGGNLVLGGINNTNGVFKLKDNSGNDIITMDKLGISLTGGAKLMGADGLLSTFIFSSDWQEIGWKNDGGSVYNMDAILQTFIPAGIVIQSAVLYVDVASRKLVGHSSVGVSDGYYAPKQMKLYHGAGKLALNYPFMSETTKLVDGATEISSFGSWTISSPSATIQQKSINVLSYVNANQLKTFKLSSAKTYVANDEYTNGGLARMTLVVTGYKGG